jgi:hypothetical protein
MSDWVVEDQSGWIGGISRGMHDAFIVVGSFWLRQVIIDVLGFRVLQGLEENILTARITKNIRKGKEGTNKSKF